MWERRSSQFPFYHSVDVHSLPVRPWLGVVLQTLATHQTYLIDLTYDKLVKDWKCALIKVGLASNHAVLYQLRHSGPSFDRQQKHRSRWR